MKGLERLSNKWVLAVVVLALVGSAVIVGTVGSPADNTINFELRKYFIQFLLIVALGAVVAFVVDGLKRKAEGEERERQRKAEGEERERQYAIDTLTSLLDRLDAIYQEVKRERRKFRLVDMTTLSKQEYVDAVAKLSDDKQDVERLWRDIEVLKRWLPELEPVPSERPGHGVLPQDPLRTNGRKSVRFRTRNFAPCRLVPSDRSTSSGTTPRARSASSGGTTERQGRIS